MNTMLCLVFFLQAELTFCTGDIITVIGEIDEDGFYYVSAFHRFLSQVQYGQRLISQQDFFWLHGRNASHSKCLTSFSRQLCPLNSQDDDIGKAVCFVKPHLCQQELEPNPLFKPPYLQARVSSRVVQVKLLALEALNCCNVQLQHLSIF